MKTKKKGTLIMDLSEPRTVDEQIATIKGIKLVNPAQINEMIEENTKKRLNAVSSIEEKIDEEMLDRFSEDLSIFQKGLILLALNWVF